jgi:4-hydroxyphenylpyruvate dioxygenase-like putative hemolysin
MPFEDFVSNVTKAFMNKNKTFTTNATCKLMGFEFLYFLVTLKEAQMKELLTDMSFLAQKKNTRKMDTFGPFIKIA